MIDPGTEKYELELSPFVRCRYKVISQGKMRIYEQSESTIYAYLAISA